jgi:hypothetical protein
MSYLLTFAMLYNCFGYKAEFSHLVVWRIVFFFLFSENDLYLFVLQFLATIVVIIM